MRKNWRIVFLILSIAFAGIVTVSAQEIDDNSYNYNSIRPIRKADIMYKKSVWYRLDLREKINAPFFSEGNWITKIVIDAVKAGVLRPYKNDSLLQRMSLQEFLENLKVPGVDGGDDMFGGGDGVFGGGDEWGGGFDDWGGDGTATIVEDAPAEFFPKQIYMLELKEDIIFNKKTSQLRHDIQSIKLIIPGDLYPTGIDKELATFSYKELVDNVFVDNPDAIWFNEKNINENKNLADAFELRQFSGRVYKFSNAKDQIVEEVYGGNQKLGLAKSLEFKYDMVDYETELWSY